MNRSRYDIFISHSSCDNIFCNQLNDLLEKAGFSIWYDEHSLLPSTHINRDLSGYVRQCESMIVVLSEHSCQSQWVIDESATARDEGKKIIPVVLDDCTLPGFFKNYKWVNCQNGLTPYSFFMILSSIYGSADNMREERDVYISHSWRDEEQHLVDNVLNILHSQQFRLIGDASNQNSYDNDDRIMKIMCTCGAFVGIMPHRGDGKTSRYILDEIAKAETLGLNGIIIADGQIKDLSELTSFPILKINNINDINTIQLKEFVNELKIERPKTPHVFYATNLDKDRRELNSLIRNLSGCVTATHCVLGEDINHGNLQQQIIDRIKTAYVMIADITGDQQCIECAHAEKVGRDKTYRFNTCIEAGIARGAGTDLYLVAKQPRHTPPFMFRDINVRYYDNDCELLAIVHKILRPYRRSVL
ncbi:toll/interleukin-1 receptor domain-containing protein [uncultured Alistipes sp.]|uniref:toll/interleukin-1 receptor domain-containing protein n=1 Tax=uncultured Alistipes sp. TaxID=538949 RepID=UPI002804296D|nr:toll/interleukin-1 receptor domain-containing protein [uncultured Alistipes sp.]